MNDYMKALYHRFEAPTEQIKRLEQRTDKLHKNLSAQLTKPQRKLLLKLVDMEAALRDQACLHSFMAGYRLAQGIQQELLADQPPYNFEHEDERLACERIERERGEHTSET